MTIVRFEKGDGIRLDNLVALMRAIEKLEDIAEFIPEMPSSLYDLPVRKVTQRVKKRRNER